MLAIRANYQNGKIILLDTIPEKIKKARLTIVVDTDELENNNITALEFNSNSINSETEFEAIGISEFFKEGNDKNIDWEDYFGLK